MSKNIVIFSDGTGQMGGVGSNTNVYKLFNMIEDRTDRQIAFYDPGIGTDRKKMTGSIAGRGFTKNILDCYKFIFENFKSKDNIYLFGFSRGSATVRSLAGFIKLFGILPNSRPELIKQAYEIYEIRDDDNKRNAKANAFIDKHHRMRCKIKFIGVWDTVAALGLPIKWISRTLDYLYPHKFHDYSLSDNVEYARHALSIDDVRESFHPLIWNKLEDDPKNERMKQVWFSGVHTDVGGGYKEDDLSNITLTWMIKEATDKGLLIYPSSRAFQELLKTTPNAFGKMHNEQENIPWKWLKAKQRIWDTDKYGKPHIHESVFERKENKENVAIPPYLPWIVENRSEEEYIKVQWDKEY